MRSWIALVIALLLPAMAFAEATTTSTTVTYSPSTELLCPDNAVLQGTKCFCKTGYKVSEAKCVKDEPPPPASNEVYQDILVSVTYNEILTCEKMGITAPIDLEMCKKIKAKPDGDWKVVPRPSVVTTMIANPWAPPSQQKMDFEMVSTTQSLPPLNPPPPPPPPIATTTPEVTEPAPEDTPAPEPEPVKEVAPAAKTTEKKKSEEKPKEQPVVEPTATSSTGAVAGTSTVAAPQVPMTPEAQLASAIASQNLVAMSSVLAGLEIIPIPEKEQPKAPEPEPTPEPEEKPSIFKRIADWLFGWI